MNSVISGRIFISLCLGLCSLGIISCKNVERKAVSRGVSDTQFYLYTTATVYPYTLYIGDDDGLGNSTFDDSNRIYIIIHGWNQDSKTDWVIDTRKSILSVENANVIEVDWGFYATTPYYNYSTAVEHMYQVADMTTSFIDWLISASETTSYDFHLIGFDLGAHCAGVAALHVQSGIIDRVTGLDPAAHYFKDVGPSERIDKSDASFVDIIHTNACLEAGTCVGLRPSVGHVDFWPNGGKYQPGCVVTNCQHNRAHEFFTESITAGDVFLTDAFMSWPCPDWESFEDDRCTSCREGCLEMGFYVERSYVGDYYLRTNQYSPYAKGDDQSV